MYTLLASLLLVTVLPTAQITVDVASGKVTQAQEPTTAAKKPLTNADVVRLVKAGLAQSTILAAIQEGILAFDTSPDALIELKVQGVPPNIIEAMLQHSPEMGTDTAVSGSAKTNALNNYSGPAKGFDSGADISLLAEGVYYKGPKGWLKLEQLNMAGGGAKHVGKMLVPGLTPQMVWTFRGAEAPVQISERRPVFYVKRSLYRANVPGRSERDLVIVRFDKKRDHRELQTTSGGSMFTFKAGYSKERMPEITTARISESVFSVIPKTDLDPGEYLISFGGVGVAGFDFGIEK